MVKNDEDDGILTIAAYETMPTTSQKGSLTPPPSKKIHQVNWDLHLLLTAQLKVWQRVPKCSRFPSVSYHLPYREWTYHMLHQWFTEFILPTSEWEGWCFFLLGELFLEPADFYNLVMPAFLWQTKLPSSEQGILYNIAQCSFPSCTILLYILENFHVFRMKKKQCK